MAPQITLYCEEAQGLRLGPGFGNIAIPGQLLVFQEGYATFDEAEYPDWRDWLRGAPHIELLDEAAGEAGSGDIAAVACPKCGKGFKTQKALNGHMMGHAPRKPKS